MHISKEILRTTHKTSLKSRIYRDYKHITLCLLFVRPAQSKFKFYVGRQS